MATKCFDTDMFNTIVARIQAGFTDLVNLVNTNPNPTGDNSLASGPWKMPGVADLWISRGGNPDTTRGDYTAVNGSVTFSAFEGRVTSESLTTNAGGTYTLTVNDDKVLLNSTVTASVANGTNTKGTAVVDGTLVAAGRITVTIKNTHVSEAFNGTILVTVKIT